MNVHTPERGADEDFAMYKVRRQLSRIQLRNLIEKVTPIFVQHGSSASRHLRRTTIGIFGIRQYKRSHNLGYRMKQAGAGWNGGILSGG